MENQAVRVISEVTAKAQANPDFAREYVNNPNGVLSDAGMEIPEGMKIHVIVGSPANSEIPNSTSTDVYLLLPQVNEEIKDESLATAAAASCQSTSSTCVTVPSCVSCVSSASTNSCS
ncbi:hypothetical protein SAMN05421594_0479 [Chryseobacterium oleae]|uniref:NHLP leader peptide domain-containing protein n=1 Tax=Chryseobacterium oleae TaxID=491207 RepID=A0A1I4VNT7_CHROL|nr:hypothetical protein [Chryseobacterium oleae]SFN02944.1 hypothetical protein SAMN05421594_0479 [Chryseobacterium oleae]